LLHLLLIRAQPSVTWSTREPPPGDPVGGYVPPRPAWQFGGGSVAAQLRA
jgi:hypothetical protein